MTTCGGADVVLVVGAVVVVVVVVGRLGITVVGAEVGAAVVLEVWTDVVEETGVVGVPLLLR
jgi:hypothetical protein